MEKKQQNYVMIITQILLMVVLIINLMDLVIVYKVIFWNVTLIVSTIFMVRIVFLFVVMVQLLGLKSVMIQIQYLMMVVICDNSPVLQIAYIVNLVSAQIAILYFTQQIIIASLIYQIMKKNNNQLIIYPYNFINTHCIKCMTEWNLFNFERVQCDDADADDCYFHEAIYGDGRGEDLEECDDGNTILFDGCYECQYQCEYNCIEFVEGVCLKLSKLKEPIILECEFGFRLIDQNWKSNCGDQIVASDEKCDDDNNEPFDGQCLACDVRYQLQNNRCYELCGDGIKLINEECDDGIYFLWMDVQKNVKLKIYGYVAHKIKKGVCASNLTIQLFNYNIQI
ncbi:unnamed protein product [Paramecium octaurelia]|uniref:Uncharacterized protein n=1 Tax=Paramecium octaurelia TaxID=43137 RepID=A0A8S1YRS4_PAROT|nr:unnamed protein product [Paramecium octaurelia]